jgi:hypothetical protein
VKEPDKESQNLFSKSELFSDVVRVPLRLSVDDIELNPAKVTAEIIRTSYDLTFNPEEIQKLYNWLGESIRDHPYAPVRIRVIGKLES